MHIEEIKKICFVGAGTMGCVNALVSAVAGYDCVVYDPRETVEWPHVLKRIVKWRRIQRCPSTI